MTIFRKLLLCGAMYVLTTAPLFAHPSHSSITEIEWNAASGRFEVAMRLCIADLEDALSAQANTRIRLTSALSCRPQLQRYLQEQFSITQENDNVCRLHWVGGEMELHHVWIYFEAESTSDDPAVGSSGPTSRPGNQTQQVRTWKELLAKPGMTSSTASPRNAPSRLPLTVCVRNSTLMAIQPEQTNIVVVTCGQHRSSAVLTTEQQKTLLSVENGGIARRTTR